MQEVEELCGYQKGHGTWKAQSMISLAKLGFQVHWIEAFDHEQLPSNISACKPYFSK